MASNDDILGARTDSYRMAVFSGSAEASSPAAANGNGAAASNGTGPGYLDVESK